MKLKTQDAGPRVCFRRQEVCALRQLRRGLSEERDTVDDWGREP